MRQAWRAPQKLFDVTGEAAGTGGNAIIDYRQFNEDPDGYIAFHTGSFESTARTKGTCFGNEGRKGDFELVRIDSQ